jgi:Protein of unknown function (DUF1016).
MIEETRATVAATVNAGLTILYWRVGKRIREEVLHCERAECGQHYQLRCSDLQGRHRTGSEQPSGLRVFASSCESESRGHAKTPFSVRWKTFCWNCRTASEDLRRRRDMPWIAWRYRAVPETATPDQHLRRLASTMQILPGGQVTFHMTTTSPTETPAWHLAHRLQTRRGE